MSGTPPRWGMSSLDHRAHAVDEDADHPYGVWVARCGQRLFMGTSLREAPPDEWSCPMCVRFTERGDTGELLAPPRRAEGGAG